MFAEKQTRRLTRQLYLAAEVIPSIQANEKYTIMVKELFEAFDVIKSYNLQEKIAYIHQNANRENIKMQLKSANLDWFTGTLSHLLSSIVYFGVFFLGAILVLLGVFKISVIIAASQLVIFIVFPLGSLTRNITSIFAAKELGKELNAILQQEEPNAVCVQKTSFETAIVFDRVCFSYHADRDEVPVVGKEAEIRQGAKHRAHDTIHRSDVFFDVNLSIKKGEKILIIGKSGSGKSTLLSLLYKKHTDYTGTIAIDGADIRNISDEDYFRLVTVVHQNPFIFDDTVKNNIMLYNSFDESQLDDAAERAGLKAFIDGLPEKYDTKIGEAASTISGGEKQRIAIARALIKNTPIILLDESTSALDNETAADIENMLLSDTDKICIIISHHVSDSLKAKVDRIISMESL